MFHNDYPTFTDTNNLSLLTFLDVGSVSFVLVRLCHVFGRRQGLRKIVRERAAVGVSKLRRIVHEVRDHAAESLLAGEQLSSDDLREDPTEFIERGQFLSS